MIEEVMISIYLRLGYTEKPKNWEFKLWRSINRGFKSYFEFPIQGVGYNKSNRNEMSREEVTALRRAEEKVEGWSLDDKYIPRGEWDVIYYSWLVEQDDFKIGQH